MDRDVACAKGEKWGEEASTHVIEYAYKKTKIIANKCECPRMTHTNEQPNGHADTGPLFPMP